MMKAIFITARLGSTRLPRKHLLEICGKTCIKHLIERVKKSKKADFIVLCTTLEKEDDKLCDIAVKNGIYYFRGSVKDKLDRWLKSCQKYDVDFFVTADGDDLFCEPLLIDLAFEQYEKTGADFIDTIPSELICGCFTHGIKTEALKKVCEIKDTEDTEMMWVYFTETNMFKVEKLQNIPLIYKRPEMRMTLDYIEDYLFFKNVIEHFDGQDYSLKDIVQYLDDYPEVIKLNNYLQEGWKKNQDKGICLKIKGKK